MRELRAQLALGPRLSKFGGDGRKRTEDATLEDDLHDAEEDQVTGPPIGEREQVARRLRAESERLSASGDELRREKEALQRDASRLRRTGNTSGASPRWRLPRRRPLGRRRAWQRLRRPGLNRW